MPSFVERKEMSLATWGALKKHIMRERHKKKQEQEADAAIKQVQREQENKQKQNAMTIEELKEEIAQVEKKLKGLKEEKQEMFLYLKRVLYEDKRRNKDKEASELMQIGHHYPNPSPSTAAAAAGSSHVAAGSSHYVIPGNSVLNQNALMYKVGAVPTQQQNGAIKRQRSPSPPTTTNYQGYRNIAHVTPYAQTYPIPHPPNQYPSQEQAKHLAASYHVPHLPPGYVSGLPQQIEHPSQKPANIQEDKYYIQTGGISTGYPIRNQPQPHSHFQPSTSHTVSAPIQVSLRKEDVMRRNMSAESHRH